MALHPAEPRNILVAVTGQTPAIVTETLWALEQRHDTPVDEIRVITTAEGKKAVLSKLLGDESPFGAYCRDYGIPPGRLSFSEKSIHVLKDVHGLDLDDIRTSEDNNLAADQVYNLIGEWCRRKDETLLCSVAGGRKTLGIYLTMSLMICARPADKLYHVLVSPAFESGVPDFFYPPPETRLFRRIAKNNPNRDMTAFETVSSDEAAVELAEIPFPKLREAIGGELPLERGFTEAVRQTQLLMNYMQAPPRLSLSLETRLISIGDFEFALTKQLAAVYAFFLLETGGRKAGIGMEALFSKRKVLADLEHQIDRHRHAEQEVYAWEKMKDVDDFRSRIGPCITKVNKAVRKTLGRNSLASRFAISTGGAYGVLIQDFEVLGDNGKPWKSLR